MIHWLTADTVTFNASLSAVIEPAAAMAAATPHSLDFVAIITNAIAEAHQPRQAFLNFIIECGAEGTHKKGRPASRPFLNVRELEFHSSATHNHEHAIGR